MMEESYQWQEKSLHKWNVKAFKDYMTPKYGDGSLVLRPRPISKALKKRIEAELQKMMKRKIFIPVIIKNNGKVHICVDYRVTANQSLKIEDFSLSD
ncbi:K02A2.6-like [Cordylochernes scorpioides]|uniref:K02A2.6-like n=1 Tax=Cordylochernes scorpioides TaxID=51811 RepID=A0ABY6LRP8_9ARAC|nr:K02A2.6-like [Cordylochernes scorpioides]